MPSARCADNAEVQHRYERISIETPRQRITGTATLAADGYRSRLSDMLNAPERDFIALVDVIVEPLDGEDGDPVAHEFIAVHRQHMVFVVSMGRVDVPENASLLGA
jgi:flavin-dependent dehydrogenase